jgi:hypothetical protein
LGNELLNGGLTDHLAEFAMEKPDICRVWLFELLSSKRPDHDPFWQKYLSNFERFVKTDLAQPGIAALDPLHCDSRVPATPKDTYRCLRWRRLPDP